MRRASILAVAAAAALGAPEAACGGGGDGSDPNAPSALTLTPVTWNASGANVGKVAAVADEGGSFAVFGGAGVIAFTGGAPVASDASIVAWRSAGVIPSADGKGTWLVGVGADGHLRRLHGAQTLEDVSDRFGLADAKVADVAASISASPPPGSAIRTAFLLDDGIAVSDGKAVSRYAGAEHAVAASPSGAIAIASDGAVRVLDAQGKETDAPLADASFVAFDASGALVAATHHALYAVDGGAARLVWDAGARTIHALVTSGANVWLAIDGDLGLWKGGAVAVTNGQTFAGDARLFGSPSGDVWMVSGGDLARFAGKTAGDDRALWTATVQPVYGRVCGNCHAPRGSGKDIAGVDLSSYEAWVALRGKVKERVVDAARTPRAMPPASSGVTLSDAERGAIAAWAGAGK